MFRATFHNNPPLSPSKREENQENDGYVDALEDITGISPSSRRELAECIDAQLDAERDPTSDRNAERVSLIPTARSVSSSVQRVVHGPASMDAHILDDRVKQKEVKELTNYRDQHFDARKRRYKRRWDVPHDNEIVEVVRYTRDEAGDRRFREDWERRNFELKKTFQFEHDEYDDCFLPDDNPAGWVWVDAVEVQKDEIANWPKHEEEQGSMVDVIKERFHKAMRWLN